MVKKAEPDMIEMTAEGIQTVLPGFYDLLYGENEIDDLSRNLFGDLVAEISLLRVFMRRALEKAQDIKELEEMLKVLNSLGLASMRLARLLEVQLKLYEKSPRGEDALTQALLKVGERLGIE